MSEETLRTLRQELEEYRRLAGWLLYHTPRGIFEMDEEMKHALIGQIVEKTEMQDGSTVYFLKTQAGVVTTNPDS